MNAVKGYKTILFNAILVVTGLAAEFGVALPENFAQDLNGAILSSIGVIGIILRAITTTPMGKNG